MIVVEKVLQDMNNNDFPWPNPVECVDVITAIIVLFVICYKDTTNQ